MAGNRIGRPVGRGAASGVVVMYVVDASVWVSRLVPADVHHDLSRRWMTASAASGALLIGPALLLPEVAAAIARRTNRTTSRTAPSH